MNITRREAIPLFTVGSLCSVTISHAQLSYATEFLFDEAIRSAADPGNYFRQEAQFAFYLELLKNKKPEEFDRANYRIDIDRNIINLTLKFCELKSKPESKNELVEIYDNDRDNIREFIQINGINSDSEAMNIVEKLYIFTFYHYHIIGLQFGYFKYIRQSDWCCWPICFSDH